MNPIDVEISRGERPRSRGADLSGPDGEKLEMVYMLCFANHAYIMIWVYFCMF